MVRNRFWKKAVPLVAMTKGDYRRGWDGHWKDGCGDREWGGRSGGTGAGERDEGWFWLFGIPTLVFATGGVQVVGGSRPVRGK